jgi:hypothetical protein
MELNDQKKFHFELQTKNFPPWYEDSIYSKQSSKKWPKGPRKESYIVLKDKYQERSESILTLIFSS